MMLGEDDTFSHLSESEWRKLVIKRFDRQDRDLKSIIGFWNAAELGGTVVKWVAVVGAGITTMWAAWHFGGK
jgi:hypothetical protein